MNGASDADSGESILASPPRLAALARTGLFIGSPRASSDAALDHLAALAARALGVQASWVALVSDAGQRIVGSSGVVNGADRGVLSGLLTRRVVVTGKPQIIEDLEAAGDVEGEDSGIAAYCGVPVTVAGQTLGALCATDPGAHRWTESDVAVLTGLAELVQREIETQIAKREEALVPPHMGPLLNAIPAGIYACDTAGRLVFYNRRAAALWGAEPSLGSSEADAFAVRGLTWQDGTPVPAAETPLQSALRSGTPTSPIELTLGAASESVVTLVSAEAVVSPLGELTGAFGVLQDTTALRQASRLRDELLALVSHELRTPLTVISGMAAFLERHGDSSGTGRAEAIEKLVLASRRMERVVENMLQLSHLDHDRADPEPLLAQMVLDKAVTAFARDFPEAAVGQLAGAQGSVVFAVESWCVLAVTNLLQNAQLYGDGSEVTVVQTVLQDSELHIRVCNPGETFNAEEYETLFEPFFRGRRTRNHIPGAGLGLTAARKLAEAQGGRLLAGPRPDGGGSMFSLALPVYQENRVR